MPWGLLWLRGSWNKTCVKYAVSGQHGNNLDSAKWHQEVPPGKEVQERKLCFCFPFSPQTFLSFPFWVSGGDLNVRGFLCLCILEEKSKPLQLFSRQSSAIKPIVTYKARFFYCRKMMDGPPPPGSQGSFMMRGSLDTTDQQTYPT